MTGEDAARGRATIGGFLSREELLGGLPARRASTLLFAIESRTAQLVVRARRALITEVSERSAQEQERAFLDAMASGRGTSAPPRIQDLDRYAPRWADLVPDDAQLRAALAKLILEKYRVPRLAGRLRAAVGMDDPPVAAAYARLYSERPEARFVVALPLAERLRWLRSRLADRLEQMPPFWIAFALTLTEMVGGGILALPIALAGFGPLGALALLIVFGVVNVITIAALAEAITRSGHMRYGTAYFGRLVSDYLGRPGLIVLSVALSALLAVVFLMGFIGFGDVLGGATGLHPVLWAAVLFVVTLFVLYRGSLDATIASAIVIGAVNLVLLGVIALASFAFAATSAEPAPASPVMPATGLVIDPATLALTFGVLLATYFGHLSVGNAAKVILARDPGGRSLVLGSALATVTVIVVYATLTVAIFSALDESVLVGYPGTVITPLAEAVGPLIYVLGAIYASLALGLGSLYAALGLYNLSAEAVGVRTSRFAVRIVPLIAVFVFVAALMLTGNASFSGPLSVVGTLTVPILSGIFPLLLVSAARRSGDRVPATVLALVGRRPLVAALWLLYVAGVLAHALIWQPSADRLLAIGATLAMVAVTFIILRRGALDPSASLEIRYTAEPGAAPDVSLMARGLRQAVSVDSEGPGGLIVRLPALDVGRLRLWAHRLAADDVSEGIAASARVEVGGEVEGEIAAQLVSLSSDGEAVVSLRQRPVSIVFSGLPVQAPGARPRP